MDPPFLGKCSWALGAKKLLPKKKPCQLGIARLLQCGERSKPPTSGYSWWSVRPGSGTVCEAVQLSLVSNLESQRSHDRRSAKRESLKAFLASWRANRRSEALFGSYIASVAEHQYVCWRLELPLATEAKGPTSEERIVATIRVTLKSIEDVGGCRPESA